MAQSIATSQGNVSSRNRPRGSWKTIIAGLWSAVSIRKLKFTPSTWEPENHSASDISGTLNIEKISARLAIEDRAKLDGKFDQPPSTEEGVAGTQREIVAYFKNLQRGAQHQITDLAEELRELGEEIDVSGVNGSVCDIPSRCENEVLRLIAESQSQLNYLGEQETQKQQHYEALHDKSKQDQVAERPMSPVFHWVFMAFLIGMGAFAIAKTSVSGFGSASFIPPSWTILISLMIVFASFVIARAVSHLINSVGRLTGWLGGALGIALIGAMASLAAYYIAAVSSNPGVAVRNVVDSILVKPIAVVTDVADWNGFGIVISAGLLAFLVSYRPASSHRGNGAMQSAIYRIRKQRDRLTKRLRMEINAIIDEADFEATELPKRLKVKVRKYSRLVDEAKRIPESLSDYDVALEDGCNILLDRYRAANTIARKSEAPLSFSEHICFRPEHEGNVSMIDDEEGRLQELQQGIVELESEAAQVRLKLRDLNSRAISALEDTPAPV